MKARLTVTRERLSSSLSYHHYCLLHPAELAVVITGEWCKGALVDYSEEAGRFAGRGVQYHLGFHHRSDLCRWVVPTIDHSLRCISLPLSLVSV